jgi:hypothetical protein
MPVTLLNYREQIQIDYKVDGDPNFPANRILVFVNQAQRFLQMQLNGLGIKRWERATKFSPPVTVTSGALVAGQVYVITIAGTGDFSNVAIVISGTINTNGCIFQANGNTIPNNWTGATLTTAGLTAASFISGTNNVQSILMSYIPSFAESPATLRFIETSDGTTWNQAKEANEVSLNNHLNNSIMTPTAKDSIFWRSDGIIYIAPLSITTAIIHFYRVVSDLALDTDVSEIPIEFMEYVIKRVGIEIDFIRNKIQDKEPAITAVTNAITNAYQKFETMGQQRQTDQKEKLQ